jgi:predicted HD phosphohydrolase
LAALLHDVGKAIDRKDHVTAALEALDGSITPRTAWLIEHHPEVRALRDGSLGARSHRRLAGSENFDELKLLAACDQAGRVCGAIVPDLDEALAYVRALARACDEP